ncbi:glycoside hydrolase family 18 protein [Acidovorax sp. GBBC 3334]|uniref:glycoside hydrolase family 18 protein n=1 Tax=Acidovorax sp. GBBC 3334 TaxID=2940496 RepID=UPI0023035B95|nr:glycoside hydrolase family 18 protein [Acidovorax sp. GBBC 3334]MDA8454820.1 glycoside hydrolase family 18 protein [Acidovorax sp. GBBC 3334]
MTTPWTRTLGIACLAFVVAPAWSEPAAPHARQRPASSAAAHAATTPAAREVVGYFTSWGIYARGYTAKSLATQGALPYLTTLNYAFGNVQPAQADGSGPIGCQLGDAWADVQRPWTAAESVDGTEVDGTQALRGNFQQLRVLKRQHPQLKVLVSLGGWNGSKWFSDAALTAASRSALAKSCIDLFIRGRIGGETEGNGVGAGVFDGFDIDWEYPAAEGAPGNTVRPEDTANFTLLLQEFRRQLDAVDPALRLTIAAPAGPQNSAKIDLAAVSKTVDFINLMAYDLHGSWESRTNHQAALAPSPRDPDRAQELSVAETVARYLQAGVPPRKIVVGAPLYSRGWSGVGTAGNGLYQAATGLPAGTFEAGIEDFKTVRAKPGFTRHWDAWARSAWLFDGSTFWTFDDEPVVREKARAVRLTGLRGLMFWELSGDGGELVRAAGDELSRSR